MSEARGLDAVADLYLVFQAFDAFRRELEDSPSIPKTHVSGIYFNTQKRFTNQLAQTLRASGSELGALVQHGTTSTPRPDPTTASPTNRPQHGSDDEDTWDD